MMSAVGEVEVVVPVNVALIKYWGKRNSSLMLPMNDSVSISLDALVANTSVKVHRSVDGKDRVVVNNKEVDLSAKLRYGRVFEELRAILGHKSNGIPDAACLHFDIVSNTNFPQSAGLASSAAGFGAIAFAFGSLFNLDQDIVVYLARLGSGSACRSVLGGFVHWMAGAAADGSDCRCEQWPMEWPSLRAIVMVVSEKEKHLGSTDGMQHTADTSELLQYRVNQVVPERVRQLRSSIDKHDFHRFAKLVMKDSNQLHAVCQDSYPPLVYLVDTSHRIIELVHRFNALEGRENENKVAYTFDAGPNACLLMESETVAKLLPILCYFFPNTREEKFIRGDCPPEINRLSVSPADFAHFEPMPDSIEYLILSEVGKGPYLLHKHI